MYFSCEPLIFLNICDKKVKLAEYNADVTLLIKKGNTKLCEVELTPENGVIYLEDDVILDFANEFHTFKIQLRNENNEVIHLEYTDCEGTEMVAELIKIRFNNCENTQNVELVQECF